MSIKSWAAIFFVVGALHLVSLVYMMHRLGEFKTWDDYSYLSVNQCAADVVSKYGDILECKPLNNPIDQLTTCLFNAGAEVMMGFQIETMNCIAKQDQAFPQTH